MLPIAAKTDGDVPAPLNPARIVNGSDPVETQDQAFVRAALAASDDCIKILDLDGRLAFMSEGGRRVMEIGDFAAVKGCPWPDFWESQGHVEARRAIETARAGGVARFQGMAKTAMGNPRWWDVKVSPIPGPDGKPARILSVSRDITELKQSEERHELLALELDHRIRNLLAMVQAMAHQTLREGLSIPAAKAVLTERLGALAAAQRLLIDATSEAVDLETLLARVLAPHASRESIALSGPPVRLSSKSAFAMALAVHELATNATKYGALSLDGGRVGVAWSLDPTDGFRFAWSESGGPPVTPPRAKGFGSLAIDRVLARQLHGVARFDFRPDGLILTIEAPADSFSQG